MEEQCGISYKGLVHRIDWFISFLLTIFFDAHCSALIKSPHVALCFSDKTRAINTVSDFFTNAQIKRTAKKKKGVC